MNAERRKVLSIGGEPELLWLRHAVLQTAGFDVLTTESEDDALAIIRRGECRVLLVCYSLSLGVLRRVVKAFRSHCPNGSIVAITNAQLNEPHFADSFVYGVEGPEVLIQSIHDA
jgi:DNA-binding NtrC family response regulator